MIKVTEICFISGMGKCLAFQLTETDRRAFAFFDHGDAFHLHPSRPSLSSFVGPTILIGDDNENAA